MAGRTIRRVVTGIDPARGAVISEDGPSPYVLSRPSRPGVTLTDLWVGEPKAPDVFSPGADHRVVLEPPRGGTTFRFVQFDPEDPDVLASIDGAAAFAEMDAAGLVVENAEHPYMHRTSTIDYAVVIEGSITLILDDDEVELSAGDAIVQRGTNHAWANRSDQPCLIAFVLVSVPASSTE